MWHKWINDDLRQMSLGDSFEPVIPLKPEDHFVGVIDDPELRKFCQLLGYYRELMEELAIETVRAFKKLSKAKRNERAREQLLLRDKYDVVCGLFWLTVSDKFPELIGKPGLAIREGWVVVWDTSEEVEEFEFPFSILFDTSLADFDLPLLETQSDDDQEDRFESLIIPNVAYASKKRH